jgi:hypothetical protein
MQIANITHTIKYSTAIDDPVSALFQLRPNPAFGCTVQLSECGTPNQSFAAIAKIASS